MRLALTGTRVRERRLLVGMKQADLARAAGVSPAYLNLIEHNRRRVGPEVLERLAAALGVEGPVLAEGAEGALFDMLREATVGAPPMAAPPELARIEEFASRFPGWAELLAARQGQVAHLTRTVESLSERMAQDPFLAASLHEVLSAITAVRSTSAILAETEDIDPEWRARFHRNIHEDSLRLTQAASGLVAWLDQSRVPEAGLATPQEELEAWLGARDWHVGELEGPAAGDPARLITGAADLASEAARGLAAVHLDRYRQDALALPLPRLRRAMDQGGADAAALAAALDLPLALVLRRLAALPSGLWPDGAAFVSCDASGTLIFRRPSPAFPLPRFGAACALWPLYEALVQPFTPIRRVLETAGRGAGARFAATAWAERHYPQGFDGPPVTRALMLVVPMASDPPARSAGPARVVGSSCRICAVRDCAARREPTILA